MASKKEDLVSIGRLTSTGANSVGLTIPREVLEDVGWDKGDRLKLSTDGTRIIMEKLDL